MTKAIKLFWDDLTTYTQQKLREAGFEETEDAPIAVIEREED